MNLLRLFYASLVFSLVLASPGQALVNGEDNSGGGAGKFRNMGFVSNGDFAANGERVGVSAVMLTNNVILTSAQVLFETPTFPNVEPPRKLPHLLRFHRDGATRELELPPQEDIEVIGDPAQTQINIKNIETIAIHPNFELKLDSTGKLVTRSLPFNMALIRIKRLNRVVTTPLANRPQTNQLAGGTATVIASGLDHNLETNVRRLGELDVLGVIPVVDSSGGFIGEFLQAGGSGTLGVCGGDEGGALIKSYPLPLGGDAPRLIGIFSSYIASRDFISLNDCIDATQDNELAFIPIWRHRGWIKNKMRSVPFDQWCIRNGPQNGGTFAPCRSRNN